MNIETTYGFGSIIKRHTGTLDTLVLKHIEKVVEDILRDAINVGPTNFPTYTQCKNFGLSPFFYFVHIGANLLTKPTMIFLTINHIFIVKNNSIVPPKLLKVKCVRVRDPPVNFMYKKPSALAGLVGEVTKTATYL
ncbi:hypothetical protein [Providencia manganoxydans]|uniref:hypothetical protein n=1 Tax=Providencia manganoxydans TaxID=2923283 RepID=UPI0034E395E4